MELAAIVGELKDLSNVVRAQEACGISREQALDMNYLALSSRIDGVENEPKDVSGLTSAIAGSEFTTEQKKSWHR